MATKRAFISLLAGVLTISILALALLPSLSATLPSLGQRLTVSDIQPELGKAFIGKLSDPNSSDHEHPSPATLYLVEARTGARCRWW